MIMGIDVGSTYTKTVWLDSGRKALLEFEINKTSVLPE